MAEAEEKLEVEGCGFLCVHEKVVEKVQHELPQEETLLRLADSATGRACASCSCC